MNDNLDCDEVCNDYDYFIFKKALGTKSASVALFLYEKLHLYLSVCV